MNGWAADILDIMDSSQDNRNIRGLKIFTVKTVEPLVITYDGVDVGASMGDKIYVHPLFTADIINLDENSIYEIQDFTSSTAYAPAFSAAIQGTMPDFIKDFYLFYKNWLSVYKLSEGDLVAVWELGDNKYIILQKITAYSIKNNKDEENKEAK